jgi:anti-sigma B factor antagonist
MLTDQPHHAAQATGPAPLRIDVTAGPGRRVIALQGELDTTNADRLRNVLNDVLIDLRRDSASQAQALVVIDLAQLTLLAAAGLNVLADCRCRLRAVGCRLVLIRPAPFVSRILSLVGLDDMLAVADSELI